MFVLVVVVGKPLAATISPRLPPRGRPARRRRRRRVVVGERSVKVRARRGERGSVGDRYRVMLRGVDVEAVRAAAEAELRVLANRRHLAFLLDDVSLLEPWRGTVSEPAPRELVAVPLEEWAAEPVEVPLSTWVEHHRREARRRRRHPGGGEPA